MDSIEFHLCRPSFVEAAYEDTEQEQAERHKRAAMVSVEFADIVNWSSIPYLEKVSSVLLNVGQAIVDKHFNL